MTRLSSGYRFRAAAGALLLSLSLMLTAVPGHGQGGTLVFETGLEGEIWQALPKFGTTPACIDQYNFGLWPYWYDECASPAPGPGELLYPVDVALYQTGALGPDGFPSNPNDYRLYVTDSFNHRVVVYRFDPAANDDDPLDGYGWSEVDVPGAQWNRDHLTLPDHLTVDGAGNVIVSDYWNERLVVFDSAGQIIATVPLGVKVYGVDVTPGTTWGVSGTIAVNGIDFSTAINHLVFVDAQDGEVLQQYEAPVGDATPGSLLFATGITYDETGSHVIVADLDNSRVVVWQADANGLIVDADPNDGTIPFTADEDNPLGLPTMTPVLVFGRPANLAAPSRADLQSPFSVMVDQRGRIVVSDTDNQRLVFYRPSYPSGAPATAEYLFELNAKGGLNGFPRGVEEDAHGRLIVVDTANHEVEVFQIPAMAIVDVAVAGPRSHAPDVLRPGAVINTTAVAGDTVSIDFSVIVPEGRPGVVNVIPSCQVTDSLGLFEGADAPVGPTLIDWIPTALHTSLGSSGEIGLIRPIDPASPSTSDVYRFRCTIVAREEGTLAFDLFAVGNDGVTATSSRTSEATVGCALCETGLPSISGEVTVPGPQPFYNTEATITLTAIDQPDTVNVDDPRATLPAAGLKRVYWQWVYGPLAFDDPYWIGCDDFPDTTISCAGPGLADGDPDGFPYPVAPDAFEVDVQVADWYEGYQILEFWAQDAAGNYSERQQIVVTLDLTPPIAAFAFPAPSGPCWVGGDGVPNCWYNTSLNVPYTVYDNLTPSNQILINGVAGASKPPLLFDQEGENAPVDFDLEDLASNQSTTSSADPFANGRIAHIDRVAPETTLACSWTDGTITLDCSAGGTFVGGTSTFTLAATDATSGVAATRYRINGGSVLVYNGPVTIEGSGTTTFTWWSRDVAGNDETPQSIQIGQNTPPLAQDAMMFLVEDSWASTTLHATDADGDAISYTILTGPQHGQVELAPGAALAIYTPNANFHGDDGFTFLADDGNGGTSIGTITIVVTPLNDPPVFPDQWETTPEDTPIDITLGATDVDGDALTYQVMVPPANGTVTLNGGILTYTPNPNYNGVDALAVRVFDGQGGQDTAIIFIEVTPVNDPPVMSDQSVTTPEDTPVDVTLVATDPEGAALSFTITGAPANGTASIAGNVLTYTPAPGYNGGDAVVVQVSDGNGGTATATVSIIVTPVADPPSVGSQTVTTPEDTPVSAAIGATHPDGLPMTYQITGAPANGTATLAGDIVTYTPAADYHGTDAIGVLVTDTNGLTAAATITVIVTPVNDAPVIDDQSVTTPEDTPIDVTLSAGDVDGDPLSFAFVVGPANGTATLAGDVVTYTPALHFHGVDTVTVQVSDGQGGTATAVVTITVTPVVDPPVANDDTATVVAGNSVVIDVLDNDVDIDGNALTVMIVDAPSNGVATVGADGSVTYTPAPGFTGLDSFTYLVSNGTLQSAPATVTVATTAQCEPGGSGGGAGALVRRHVMLNGGSVTGGSIQVMTAANVTFNGAAEVTGDILMAGMPTIQVNGQPAAYAGVIDGLGAPTPTGHIVTINGGSKLGHVVRRTDPVTLPVVTVPPSPAGTRNVTLSNGNQSPGDFATIRNLTIQGNVGAVAVPPGTYGKFIANGNNAFVLGVAGATTASEYDFQELTLNGNSRLQVVGPVVVTLKGPVTVNGDSGAEDHPEWLTVRVANGGLTLNGSVKFYGFVEAPNGEVIVNGGTRLVGGLKADSLRVNGGGRLVLAESDSDPCPPPVVNVPPVAADDTATTSAGVGVAIDVLANDVDADGDTLTVLILSQPANGTVTIGAGGVLVYSPNAGFSGTDTFTYAVTDGKDQSSPASVSVAVTALNQAPFCGNAYGSPALVAWPPNHRQVTIDILGLTDPDGDTLTITVDSIWQDEPTNTQGDGNTNVDGGVLADGRPWVRAERMGGGQKDGRVYEIRFTASDGTASCTGTVFIGVPHDQRGTPPVDSGSRWNSMTGQIVSGSSSGGGSDDDSHHEGDGCRDGDRDYEKHHGKMGGSKGGRDDDDDKYSGRDDKDDSKKDDSKKDDSKKGDSKKDDSKKDDSKKGDSKKDDSKKGDSKGKK